MCVNSILNTNSCFDVSRTASFKSGHLILAFYKKGRTGDFLLTRSNHHLLLPV